MKRILCLFLIGSFISANGQHNDLIVNTSLDSTDCRINSITGKGLLDGQIKFSIKGQKEGFQYSIDKTDVFYVKIDTTSTFNQSGSRISSEDIRPKYFNTNFDYTKSYFLKTGRAPKPDDPFQKVARYIERDDPSEKWRYRTGKNLKTAGGLMIGGAVLSFLGTLVLSQPNMSEPVSGYVLLGASGISMLTGYGFLIVAGNSLQEK